MTNHEYMAEDEWRFILADLRAAKWVLRTNPRTEDHVLAKKFFSIHQFFLRNIGRERPELFQDVDRGFLLEVVRRWIVLYCRTIGALAHRYPRTATTNDLELRDINWSEGLGISYTGILRGMSYASRYAEYWAERSLRCRRTFASYDSRMRFVGSPAYWDICELITDKQLVVVDQLENAATSYDMLGVTAASEQRHDLRAIFNRQGWRVDLVDIDAERILMWYATHGPGVRPPERASAA
jgi:hypothetical protein